MGTKVMILLVNAIKNELFNKSIAKTQDEMPQKCRMKYICNGESNGMEVQVQIKYQIIKIKIHKS